MAAARRRKAPARKARKAGRKVSRRPRARSRAKRPAPKRRVAAPKKPAPSSRSYGTRRDLNAPIAKFLKKLDDNHRTIVERIRVIVRGAVPGVQEGLKWGMPVWSKDGLLCYTAPAKKYIRFGFYKGGIVDDAAGLPVEGSSAMAHVKLTSPTQIVEEAFSNWVRKAAALNAG
jgi:hypothetical protein